MIKLYVFYVLCVGGSNKTQEALKLYVKISCYVTTFNYSPTPVISIHVRNHTVIFSFINLYTFINLFKLVQPILKEILTQVALHELVFQLSMSHISLYAEKKRINTNFQYNDCLLMFLPKRFKFYGKIL